MKKAISWINEHKRAWRAGIMVLVLAAMAGPWVFERVNVPAEYPCDPPFVRLEGDFCGYPYSGISAFSQLIGGAAQIVGGLIEGTIIFSERADELAILSLLLVCLSFILLPLFTTLRLIVIKAPQHRPVFLVIAWSVAATLSLLLAVLDFHWAAWGRWLYTGTAASALTLEVLSQKTSRSLPEKTAPS